MEAYNYTETSQLMLQPQECNSCRHMIDRPFPPFFGRVPCGHGYCNICLGSLFWRSVTRESRYPPRCCQQEIPLEGNEKIIGPLTVQHVKERAVRFTNFRRTFCHNPTCSVLIPRFLYTGNMARCDKCFATTCILCKGKYHDGDCPFDEDLQKLLDLAKQKGWQRCPACQTMVERELGCDNIICQCETKFCYRCGLKSKECRCGLEVPTSELPTRRGAGHKRGRIYRLVARFTGYIFHAKPQLL